MRKGYEGETEETKCLQLYLFATMKNKGFLKLKKEYYKQNLTKFAIDHLGAKCWAK